MKDETTDRTEPQANPGYAVFRIAKALATAQEHPDAATRARAQQKIAKWLSVLEGMLQGGFNVGSRTPLQGVPGWVTLEVVTGGFVTGNKLAGGPLLQHEQALLTELPPAPRGTERRVLNAYFLSDEGLTVLTDRLRTGCYDIAVPEEGTLLVVAWLVQNGHAEEARELLEVIGPFLHELRFYPVPIDRPRSFGSRVFVQSIGEAIDALKRIGPNPQILTQKEAVDIWAPLYDQMIGLFLETVEGQPPFLRREADGQRIKPAKNARFPVEGGWPCRHYPDGWHLRATTVLRQIEHERTQHNECSRPDRAKGTFAQLRKYLRRCAADPKSLAGRDVGRIRLVLAGYIDKHGLPDSPECRAWRQRQAEDVGAPTFQQVAQAVLPRLSSHPRDGGLDDLDSVVKPIAPDEAARLTIPAGTLVPPSIQTKIERSLTDTVNALVERGVITSGEVLAKVLPQITSGLRAAAIASPALRQLYAAIYRAFRRRRSLLLLNLQSQIRIEELPWVAAIDRFRNENPSTRELARQTLEEVSVLTLGSFPQAIVPNKLVRELRALAKGAGMDLPLVDELAADIFMGEFSGPFVKAAKTAARLLEGSLYATHYGIDYQPVRHLPEPVKTPRSWLERQTSPSTDPLAELCTTRAGVSLGTWDPAINGMIIEQQQILTTQNLAVLFDGLNLQRTMGDSLLELSQNCFAWICRRQQMKATKWHAKLIMLKNTAYAWRQTVFFLALLSQEHQQSFLTWAIEHLDKQPESYRVRFSPALQGLIQAVHGQPPGNGAEQDGRARVFLGWSKHRHWLLDDKP